MHSHLLQMHGRRGITAALILACATAAGLAQPSTPAENRHARQDGRFIPKLRWISPRGELPGTYRQYLQAHPLRPARFSQRRPQIAPPGAAAHRAPLASDISILVDDALYPSIAARLVQYEADLAADGYAVYTETVSGGTPEDVKAWVQGRYAAGSDGVLFIGDITAAWAEVSGSIFPSDLFYMDLDGYWDDLNADGVYEVHEAGSGDEGPELYVARIYAHTLDYDTEPNMVNGYLDKAHAYRIGALSQPWRGLEYVDEDWHTMDVALDLVYGDDIERFDYGYLTTGVDYLEQMDLGRHFVQVCAHSYSGGHHFGTRPTESAAYAHAYVYSPSSRSARLLLGSDDGIRAWLNGGLVSDHDVYQGWLPDQFVENVTLDAGWNRLLCKVSQGGGDYSFSARFTDLQGADLADLRYQLSDPDTHGDEPDYIRGWLVNGFHQDISDNFWDYLTTNYLGVDESGVNPGAGESMGGKTWTAHSAGGGYVDLDAYAGQADFGCTYAFARIYADFTKFCQLRVGYDDGVQIWLNGQGIVYDNRYGGYEHDMTSVDVTLSAGENRLLVKVSEWMGEHGFSARFCQSDGGRVEGLTYDPVPDPISFIGTWLMNGPYLNPDGATRLSQDYLAGEDLVRPSEGDPAPVGTWERATGSGEPFDIALFYDHGDWVYSQTIQDRDPPVLFYNLFSCGPGRFTDDNYLAGAYIFNTTYGLITVASAKSGSMLNFQDFTTPLGQQKSIGEAYLQWFDAQAPFELWEREWYYGMVLNGDPTLRVLRRGDLDTDGDVDTGDFALFEGCFTGPGGGPLPWECVLGDFDGDDDIDCQDWDGFQAAWTETGDPPVLQPCSAECGNGLVEYGELCDTAITPGEPGACPTECTSGDPCVIATLIDPGTCTAHCDFEVITQRVTGDGCCPEGANAISDGDCEPVCGNAVCEADEVTTCVPDCLCAEDDDCNDQFVCTYDRCLGDTCTYTPRPYGDVDRNDVPNVFDVFCILDGIAGDFGACSLKDMDIHPCEPDGVPNLFDIFAVLDAIAGTDACCSE